MTLGLILDPTALRSDDITDPGPDFGAIRGKVIGFRVDIMWRAWDWVSEIWAEELRKAGADVKFWRAGGRTGEDGERMAKELAAFLASIDAAIIGLGNCGSCTGWTIHDALASAAAGLPTAAIVTSNFEGLGRNLARRGGRSGLRLHVLPYPLNERAREDVEGVAREHLPLLLNTIGAPLRSGQQAA